MPPKPAVARLQLRPRGGREIASSSPCAGMLAYTTRETLELLRDPIRLSFALLGTAFLMLIFGFGITTDVDNLSFAVLDRDQTPESRAYLGELRGSRYFVEKAPIADYADLDGACAAATSKPRSRSLPDFGRDIKKGRSNLGRRMDRWRDAVPRRDDPRLPAGRASALPRRSRRWPRPCNRLAARRHSRDPLSLQPGFQERVRHGAFDHCDPASPHSRDPDGAGDRPREGARLDHQLLRHARDQHRVSDRQAASLHRRRSGRFRRPVSDGAFCLRRAAQGQLRDARARRPALRHRDDRLRHADIFVYPAPRLPPCSAPRS